MPLRLQDECDILLACAQLFEASNIVECVVATTMSCDSTSSSRVLCSAPLSPISSPERGSPPSPLSIQQHIESRQRQSSSSSSSGPGTLLSSVPASPVRTRSASCPDAADDPVRTNSSAFEAAASRERRGKVLRRHFASVGSGSRRSSLRKRQSDFRKKQKVHRTFVHVSQWIVIIGIGIVVYFDVLMILPHLTSIFWAIVWAVLLMKPREALLAFHDRIRDWGGSKLRPRIMITFVLIYAIVLSTTPPIFTAILSTICMAILLFMLYGDRHTVVASVLLVSVLVFIAIPTGILLKSSVEEMEEMIRRATDFINQNPEVQQMFDDFGSSSLYIWCGKYVASWGYEMPQWDAGRFKSAAINALSWLGNNVAVLYSASVNVVSTTGRFMMSFITFLTFLFYLLKQPGASLFSFLDGLSPFSDNDTQRLYVSAKRSLSRACVCSLLIGALHMSVTFITCRICGLEFTTILSILSGLLAMLPMISSWAVWVPVSLGLYFSGSKIYGIGLAITHILVEMYLDTLILSFIPGNAYFIGLAVVTGCYVFGPGGVLAGPLLAGFSATVLDIYRDYISSDFLGSDANTAPANTTPPKQRSRSMLDLDTWLAHLLNRTPAPSPHSRSII